MSLIILKKKLKFKIDCVGARQIMSFPISLLLVNGEHTYNKVCLNGVFGYTHPKFKLVFGRDKQ